MVYTTVNRAGLPIVREGNVEPVSQPTSQPASGYSASSYSPPTTGTSGSITSTSTSGTKTTSITSVTSPTNNSATSYSIPRKPTSGIVAQYPSSGSTTSTSTSETSTTIGGSTTSTTSGGSIYTTPVTPPTSNPATSYSVSSSSGTQYHPSSQPVWHPPPIEGAPPPSVESYNQVVSKILSVTKQLQGLAPATEATTTTPTGVAHLWIGWKIEPWEEDFVKKFIKAFEHGRHAPRPPIQLPQMGGVLTPIPGAPAPGAPVTILPPQGTGNQQQLTA